ncbi:MAG: hypothetical protein QNJ40_01935 [Xanthomonadales bacterium]|nr:hypothetical protein [Xanthomonadales bacterium]
MKKLLTALIALGFLVGGSAASACALTAWSSDTGPAVGGPAETNALSRYSGLCSMAPGAVGQYVQDNNPTNEGRIIVSFYVFAGSATQPVTGTGNIFTAYAEDGATTEVFSIGFDAGAGTVNATPVSGTAASAAIGAGWNQVVVDWTGGGGISLWVNSDATSDPADGTGTDTGAATIGAVQLGALTGSLAGAVFDQYESRRTTLIPPAPAGDANGDGTIALADAILILREALGLDFSTGQPDADRDGSVALADAIRALRISLGLPV